MLTAVSCPFNSACCLLPILLSSPVLHVTPLLTNAQWLPIPSWTKFILLIRLSVWLWLTLHFGPHWLESDSGETSPSILRTVSMGNFNCCKRTTQKSWRPLVFRMSLSNIKNVFSKIDVKVQSTWAEKFYFSMHFLFLPPLFLHSIIITVDLLLFL